jgi:hypothetical protein
MDKITEEILKSWYQAHKQAEGNASLLLIDHSMFGVLCGARMNVCSIVDHMLYELDERSECEELVRHLKSNKDKGCTSCRLSSFLGKNHPECNEKINEWFSSQKALMEFIETVYF